MIRELSTIIKVFMINDTTATPLDKIAKQSKLVEGKLVRLYKIYFGNIFFKKSA